MELLRKYGNVGLDLMLKLVARLVPAAYRKAVVACLAGGLGTALSLFAEDGVLTGMEMGYALGVALTALGVVYRVPNASKEPTPDQP